MIAGQKLVASDGYEVCLFPLPYLYISQGEYGSYSHQGILAMDCIGWSTSGRVYDAPLYAPVSCKCIAKWSSVDNGQVFESLDKVHCADGVLRYINFMCFHDENRIANVGDIFMQGEVFAHTGNAGHSTGDHSHLNFANGKYAGWEHVPPENKGELVNSAHIYNICFMNGTILYRPDSYNWLFYNITPTNIYRKKFPWVLYARKLRNNLTSFK